MYNHSNVLVATGSLCLTITLMLAWCLAGVRASTFMKRLFPNYQSLLKAHMDYLLMTGLLMIFYLLFAQFHVSPSPVILAAMCLGSLGNPVRFLVLGVKPSLRQHPTSPFGAATTVSFALTTVGTPAPPGPWGGPHYWLCDVLDSMSAMRCHLLTTRFARCPTTWP